MNDTEITALIQEALMSVAPQQAAALDSLDLSVKISSLGIDSVAAMEMVGFVEEQLDITFPDEDLAQLSTFEDLASLIRREKA